MNRANVADSERRDAITRLFITDALEANGRDRAEAIYQLLDAAGSLIISAAKHAGLDAHEQALIGAQYLVDQIIDNLGAAE